MKRFSQKVAKDAKCWMSFLLALIPLRPWRPSAILFLSPLVTLAEPSVRLELGKPEAWTGERLDFFIELRADGSFDGAPSFDLPEVPGTVIFKLGNPVLGSLTEDDTEYFTQRHEFALFSQADGAIELPPVRVRFAHRKGYTGPSFDESLETRPARITIRRPPGSSDLGFLVTTDSLDIEESWDPAPGPVEVGAVFKRSIVQTADNLSGIALAPAPADAPEGVRFYPGEPAVEDTSARGSLSGERRETLTYLVQQAGLHTLPAIRYDWWNPATRMLESKTLPAVSFTATAPPPPPAQPSPMRFLWLVPAALVVVLPLVFRRQLRAAARWLRDRIDPPSRRAARSFLRACHHDDPAAASREWSRLRALRPDLPASPELEARLLELQRCRFGPGPAGSWSGRELAVAFRELPSGHRHETRGPALPPLNP